MGAVGEVEGLEDVGNHAEVIEVGERGALGRRITLAEDADGDMARGGRCGCGDGAFPGKGDGECDPGEEDEVAHGDDGEIRKVGLGTLGGKADVNLSDRHDFRIVAVAAVVVVFFHLLLCV